MSFTSDILTLIWSFFKASMKALSVDIASVLSFTGRHFETLLYSWGYTIGRYGIFIPSLLAVIVGITIAGLFAVFEVLDTAKDLVGGD